MAKTVLVPRRARVEEIADELLRLRKDHQYRINLLFERSRSEFPHAEFTYDHVIFNHVQIWSPYRMSIYEARGNVLDPLPGSKSNDAYRIRNGFQVILPFLELDLPEEDTDLEPFDSDWRSETPWAPEDEFLSDTKGNCSNLVDEYLRELSVRKPEFKYASSATSGDSPDDLYLALTRSRYVRKTDDGYVGYPVIPPPQAVVAAVRESRKEVPILPL